ncbi:MAG: asparagine synthase (glutamine-hydrolyzing) [Planctomycetes bacterium]|nr:asparagine synthase (glutamine-hydrolyzing) [Planctomycetota bacterium]
MCGIAGYFGTRKIGRAAIDGCLKLMGRRGPDYAGFRQFVNQTGRNVCLLHSRLSILDLDPRSNQPFNVADKWLVFNGELYNYVERKAELSAMGEKFQTTSDTEVLIHCIRRQGLAVLDKCEGMWAFAYYDQADGALALCRDRFGEKPLYYYQDDAGLYFGSEVKFIHALLGRRLAVNIDHLYRYIVNGYKALYKEDKTFFVGLKEVPSAGLLKIDAAGNVSRSSYWRPRLAVQDGMTRQDAIEGARKRLFRAVEIRLRADVPLAFCMSGGVDSNSLISIAKNIFGYDVHGFTIVNSDARYEEQDMVDYAVRQLKIKHTPIPVNTSSFLSKLRELVKYHDSPVYTISYYAHWLLMESIHANGYRISVSGTAADELFSGYYDHHVMYLAGVKNDPALHEASLLAWEKHVKPIVRNRYLSDPEMFVRDRDFRGHIYLDADDFASYLHKPWAESFAESNYAAGLLQNRMLNELFNEAVPVILHEDDLNAMYYSIENRSPFLDRDLMEFCFSIPPRHLVRDGCAKSVLRDSMAGIVPQAILDNRRKVGFNAPIFSFLDVRDPAVRSELLADGPIWGHIRKDKIEKIIEKPDLPNSESKFLFYFLSSKMFLEELG